jgi:hypothetical protein
LHILGQNSNLTLSGSYHLLIAQSSNPHAKKPILGKPSKSHLIGAWHKYNSYLDTSTIENGHWFVKSNRPNKYWFANEKYKWCEPLDHVVKQPSTKMILPQESWKSSLRSVTQWKLVSRHQHYCNWMEWGHKVTYTLIS